ncbi:beta-ketoacyl-ACP synthase II [Paenibacillus albicereus]|uniref:3-oxoacyl-[acyl-carrier-protein] synthase 2 n=1 Tax=Paenibacillus albicereus TaxID=2726185 RepID=A0A6H2GV75_9BACL|nr:beta-ketoacyl-ACP synthase II [Paenibacillus albicereus]QJC51331.1 beta-ketoacyl-ACP synthase II [Paenibacillus albicereus]
MLLHRKESAAFKEHRVVITGMGAVSPFGAGAETLWSAQAQGRSGIRRIRESDWPEEWLEQADPQAIAGFVPDWDGEVRFGRKEARKMDRFVQFALAAAEEALAQSGLGEGRLVADRTAVYVGSGIGGLGTLMEQARVLGSRGHGRVSPTLVPMMIANMAAAEISIRYGLTGPALAPVTACSIGNTAIGEATRLLRAGIADVAIAGGTEAAVVPIGVASFDNATALASFDGDPTAASRPFGRSRTGFVMAEGAGIVVLETLAHALARGAEPLAEVLGYGASSDAYHRVATEPTGRGAAAAMRLALADAGLEAERVDIVCAHATGTPAGDLSESRAILGALGDRGGIVPVFAGKSMTGHMLGAAGGAQAITLVRMLREGLIAPTLNQDEPDPDCGLRVLAATRREKLEVGLSNSFGFGGHNAVLALGRIEAV